MDLPDIQFVVVYGVPKSMSNLTIVCVQKTILFHTQLFGRAGRGGCISWAHLLYNSRQKNVNEDIKKSQNEHSSMYGK